MRPRGIKEAQVRLCKEQTIKSGLNKVTMIESRAANAVDIVICQEFTLIGQSCPRYNARECQESFAVTWYPMTFKR